MFTATKSDLAAANLLTVAREIMLNHGITFRINADKSVDFAGDDTEEMYAEIDAAERAVPRETVVVNLGGWTCVEPSTEDSARDRRVDARVAAKRARRAA